MCGCVGVWPCGRAGVCGRVSVCLAADIYTPPGKTERVINIVSGISSVAASASAAAVCLV